MELLASAFVTFLVVLDPIGTAALFAGMTRSISVAHRNQMARRATMLAGIILLSFALGGESLLSALGVTLPAFRIAGGVMLMLLAIDMVFARSSGLRATTLHEDQEAEQREDITVFPLAFPLIAGPGAMTSVVLLMSKADGGAWQIAKVLGALVVVLVMLLALLLVAGRILTLLGVTGSNVISRVLGIILAGLAAQFILDGVLLAFHH